MVAGRSYFKFNGVSSLDFGLGIEEKKITKRARKRLSIISVPGRSQDYVYGDGTWENMEVTYRVWCVSKEKDEIFQRVDEIIRWLSPEKYCVLADNYDPEYFRYGVCTGPVDPELLLRRAALQELVFTCDPYKYSWAGNQVLRFRGTTAKIHNLEGYEALPVIRVYGAGSIKLTVNGQSWTLANVATRIDLDSAAMRTTDGLTGNAADSKKTGSGYPVLVPGENTVTISGISGGIADQIGIIPRWRRI